MLFGGEETLAGFLDRLLGRGGAVGDPEAFRHFLRGQAAFTAQKTVLDYCRVKSGRSEKQVFADDGFQAALHHCRWQVYLAALSDMAALAEAWLRPCVPHGAEAALAAGLVRLHAKALEDEPPPDEERQTGTDRRVALPGHLAAMQLAAPKPANLLPLLAEAPLLATLPIHPDQRRGETPSIRGALRFHVVTTQQEMERRFDRGRLAEAIADAA